MPTATRSSGRRRIEATDFTAKLDLARPAAGRADFLSRAVAGPARPEDARASRRSAASSRRRRRTRPRDVKVAFTGDVCGQGWGIDPARGGLKMFETMRRAEPDLFIHLGDTIYADNPIPAEVQARRRHALEERHDARKAARRPDRSTISAATTATTCSTKTCADSTRQSRQLVLWDDHETHNNWFPAGPVCRPALSASKARPCLPRGPARRFSNTSRSASSPAIASGSIAASGSARCSKCSPGTCGATAARTRPNRQAELTAESAILGAPQLAWLKPRLQASTATWKVIASDMPLGLIIADGHDFEAVANGDGGPPLGRELEIADLFNSSATRRSQNVVFITADVHYAAAHYYDPAQAKFTEFKPVLGVRRRPGPRRHVRPRPARRHLRPAAQIPRHPARHEGQPPARAKAFSSSARSISPPARKC